MISFMFTSENIKKRVQLFSSLPMTSVYVYAQTLQGRDYFLNKKVQDTLIPFTFTSENFKIMVQFFSTLPMFSDYAYTQTHERRDKFF